MIENSSKTKTNELNFETWMELWQDSPEAFEFLRTKRINAFIDSVPEEHRERLRCLQWKIDRVRERAANPLAATIAISEMMWQSFNELGERYRELTDIVQGRETTKTRRSATVLPFNRAAFARS